MIIFDQLRISDGGDKMYINAHVQIKYQKLLPALLIQIIYIQKQ